ncbi:MAG TPA: NAD(P)H-hydrate dehydratase [Ferruginibacter sp.]|nr:NAD(P)H-hydrate dehydratase [Ferruginibacter sp.]
MSSEKIPYLTKEIIKGLIKPRVADSHKGTYGHTLLVAGNRGRMGAAVLAARACLRTGTGLLTVNIPEEERFILQTTIPEAMLLFREYKLLDLDKYSAIGIGPAIGLDSISSELMMDILHQYKKSVLLDADALTILAQHRDLWDLLPKGLVLTPHVKEFDRLFGESDTKEARINKAIELSTQYHWVIVLKDYETLIVENGQACLSKTGNPGLAKGGSGDILSGMITALLAQGYSSFSAAKIGVYLHGLAADIAVKEQSLESLLASDVIEKIGAAFKAVE